MQAAIAICSILAIWLLTSKKPGTRVWGCVIGALGQPFWFVSAWESGQWGVALLSFWYAFCYVRGFFTNRSHLYE
jgi:hypothetical protein